MSYIFNQDQEQFRPIQDYPEYEIGDHGTVRSLKFGKVRVLNARLSTNGYLFVSLYKDGKVTNIRIHRLVGQSFCENDNPNIKTVINHKDSCKTNNKASNIEWCTHKYNTEEAWRLGLCEKVRQAVRQVGRDSAGENHGCCKLTDIDCANIKIKYATGNYTQREIAEEFGVSQNQICLIVNNKSRSRPTPQIFQ